MRASVCVCGSLLSLGVFGLCNIYQRRRSTVVRGDVVEELRWAKESESSQTTTTRYPDRLAETVETFELEKPLNLHSIHP